MTPLGPRTYTSIVALCGHTAAAGDEVRDNPLTFSQPDHELPEYHLCHSPLSVPCTKTSRRPEPHEQAPGAVFAIITPPRLCQADHVVPVHALCHSAPFAPRAKTSTRLALHAQAAGDDVRTPPRFCQPDHEVPPSVDHL